jgi:hypothetical protein
MRNSGEEGERKWVALVDLWANFRLEVSGGEKYSMGHIGCGTIEGFLSEIDTFDGMCDDWDGAYRGDFRYECRDALFELLDNSSLSKELIEEIKKKHNDTHFDDDDE